VITVLLTAGHDLVLFCRGDHGWWRWVILPIFREPV